MAHYAELNENNEVIYVIYMDNEIILNENGEEDEELGIQHLHKHHGSDRRWVRTSYRGNFRGLYAVIGYYYHEEWDEFVLPQPYPSWSLNDETHKWEAPVQKPSGYFEFDQEWIEETQTWFSIKEYLYNKYAKNYEYSDIQEVVERFNLEEKKTIPILETEDYFVGLEKMKNFIMFHLPFIRLTPSAMEKWSVDYNEIIVKQMNCDLFGISKIDDEERRKQINTMSKILSDFEFLEEINNWVIYKRSNVL